MMHFDIATVGTSLTAGTGTGWNGSAVRQGGQWQPILERALQPGKQQAIRCHNYGFGGKTSPWGISVEAPKVARLRPRIVTIEYSMNDCSNTQGISAAQSVANAVTIMDTIRATTPDCKFVLMTMNPTNHAARTALQSYYQAYRDYVASNPGVYLVDNALAWPTLDLNEIPDGIHPKLEYVVQKLIPDMASVIGPLIP